MPATAHIQMAIVLAVWVGIHSAILDQVNKQVPEPYMDEPFHFPQTVAYCNKQYDHWDEKITTPPGLYIVGVLWVKFLETVAHASSSVSAAVEPACSLPMLRSLNVLLNIGNFLVVIALIRKRAKAAGRMITHTDSIISALALCSVPTHFFFSFLYYTDAGGLLCVLFMYYYSHDETDYYKGALFGMVSVFFRQTNVIWVCFVAGTLGVEKLHASCLVNNKDGLLDAIWRQRVWLLKRWISYTLVVIAFIYFVIRNEGIVLGDKTNHVAVLHGVQVFYFATFAFVCTGEVWEVVFNLPQTLRKGIKTSTKRLLGFGLLVSVVVVVIYHTTMTHPFLLADNRHYTFYLWRYTVRRHWMFKFVAAPVYVISMISLGKRAQSSGIEWPSMLVYFIAILLTLVPSPLVEPRYFTVAFFVLGVNLHHSRKSALMCIAVNVFINAVTLYLFLYRSFQATDGTVSRFMW